MIIDILSGKGGTGKTTLSLHTAGLIAATGRRVAVLDRDGHSASASSWYEYARSLRDPRITVTRDRGAVSGCDVLIVDHPPQIDSWPIGGTALLVVRPSMLDVLAARRAGRLLEGVRIVDVINCLDVTRAEDRDIVAEIAPAAVLRDRSIYKRTLSAGYTLADDEIANWYGAREARAELRNLVDQLLLEESDK